MSPDDIATAIADALAQGGAQWLIASIVAFLPALWTMALVLHLGRPYVLRTLRRCGLRLGADVWWMSYLLTRDAVLLMTFALSWIFFLPAVVANSALPITGSVAALFLLLALAVKIARRVDDDINAYRLATIFLVAGATLYYFPQVFAVEGADQPALQGIATALTSNTNVTVALWLMWISLAGVALVALYLFVHALNSVNRRARAGAPAPTAPIRRSARAA
ncbi:MAG TPA: hypothetical protein VFQ25_11340 [Ktedonobacterales bacterium]|nr:hypothetical protein [Ktedonobacterales bacterium]